MELLIQILTALYFFIGTIFWALELGYSKDKELEILLAPLYVGLWPLVVAYQTGSRLRR